MSQGNCTTCGLPTEGFKCEECGVELETRDLEHSCGADYLMPRCTGCDEAETNCACS